MFCLLLVVRIKQQMLGSTFAVHTLATWPCNDHAYVEFNVWGPHTGIMTMHWRSVAACDRKQTCHEIVWYFQCSLVLALSLLLHLWSIVTVSMFGVHALASWPCISRVLLPVVGNEHAYVGFNGWGPRTGIMTMHWWSVAACGRKWTWYVIVWHFHYHFILWVLDFIEQVIKYDQRSPVFFVPSWS